MNILLFDDEISALQETEAAVSAALPTAQLFSFNSILKASEFVGTTPIDIAFWDVDMRFMRLFVGAILSSQGVINCYPNCKLIYCIDDDKEVKNIPHVKNSIYLVKPITPEKVQEVLAKLHYPLNE